jgi:Cu+-exporting ATPase
MQVVANEREMSMENPVAVKSVVKDPVSGMDVDTSAAAGQADHKGHTYYFCGLKCKETFELNPEQYVSNSGASSKGCCGCCS